MKTQFQGNPLIEIPKNIPSYNFLIGNFGKEFLEEYNGIVKSNYKDNSNLKVLKFTDNVIKGSNSYSIFLVNDILSKQGLRTATSSDVQKIVNKDKSFLSGIYVDLGIVLRTKNSPNEYLAKQLGKQAKERNYEFSNKSPLVFKASDLELILDNNSDSGLGFKIKESANPFNASELNNRNDGEKFNQTNENGIPIFDKKGNRTLYTREDGLSRFYLDWDSDLYSRSGNLANSNDDGRVVVAKDAEGVAQKILKDYAINLQKERDKQIDKINKKYEKALNFLIS